MRKLTVNQVLRRALERRLEGARKRLEKIQVEIRETEAALLSIPVEPEVTEVAEPQEVAEE